MKTLRDIRDEIYAKEKENQEMKFYSLRDKICRVDTIREAWRIISSNRGSPGIDGKTIEWIKEEGVDLYWSPLYLYHLIVESCLYIVQQVRNQITHQEVII